MPDVRVSGSVIGLIEGIAESSASLLKVFSGWLSDRMGKRKILMIASYGISALCRPVIALSMLWGHVLAFRYDRFLKNFWSWIVFGPLHKLSLWRWKHRNYKFFVEIYMYLTYKRLGRFFIMLEKMIKS